ncbi:MAG: HAMP domain-containing sensor histidine kinase [Casimicrobiaceae bacterium]
MDNAQNITEQLQALAAHLTARREAIMQAWRKSIEHDPEMMTGASLPRAQLNDHVPGLLDAYGQKLQAATRTQKSTLQDEHKDDAAAHGLQRWQQGYDLREVTREWGRLQLCVMDELEAYASVHTDLEAGVMSTARRTWVEVCTEGASESASEYFHLQQIEATGHVRDLEHAMQQVQASARQRAEMWQQAAHDLRGNLGVVANATAVLGLQGVPEQARDRFLRVLDRNVTSLASLLEDVTSLARLQAGHEQRQVKPFDAAQTLRELCERMQPLAEERKLYLKVEGASQLAVEGDAVKMQRIAQNLLLNGIKYTKAGGVTVSWGDSRSDDAQRWMLCVQDTGPGFHAGPGAPIAGALEEATEESRNVEATQHGSGRSTGAGDTRPTGDTDLRAVHQEQGEGIGLSIVKRLCELLDASIEMESSPGDGTTIRVLFPRSYAAK